MTILNINQTDELKIIDVSGYSHLSLDAEWARLQDKEDNKTGKKADFITVQCGFSKSDGVVDLVVVFWNSKYATPVSSEIDTLEDSLNIKITIVVTDLIDKENLLNFLSLPNTIEILMYYSPKDLQGLLGKDKWREMLLETVAGKKTVNKRRRLNVDDFTVVDGDKECKVSVTDLVAMFNLSLDEASSEGGKLNGFITRKNL